MYGIFIVPKLVVTSSVLSYTLIVSYPAYPIVVFCTVWDIQKLTHLVLHIFPLCVDYTLLIKLLMHKKYVICTSS